MSITTKKSNPNKPPRILIFGQEGAGKSTFGAKAENPIFISPEGGTDQLTNMKGEPVDEMPNVSSWSAVMGAVETLIREKHEFKTLVIDSLDWIEGLAHKHIIGGSGKSIIHCSGGYGAGYRESQNLHAALFERLSVLRESKDMNIVITAHAHVKQVKDPGMMEEYDAFEIKCHEFVSSIAREWVDGLFFVRFRTFLKSGDTAKARALSDGTRVLYTVKQPAFQAKNRYGMPGEIEFKEDFWTTHLMKYAKKGVQEESQDQVKAEVEELLLRVTDEKIRTTVTTAIKEGKDLKPFRARLREITGVK